MSLLVLKSPIARHFDVVLVGLAMADNKCKERTGNKLELGLTDASREARRISTRVHRTRRFRRVHGLRVGHPPSPTAAERRQHVAAGFSLRWRFEAIGRI